MSPSSSIPSQGINPIDKASRSRHNSVALAVPPPDVDATPRKQGSPIPVRPEVHYTCFIRLPFPRPDDFSDPPPVEWDSAKDKALWKLVSKASTNSRDLDWEAIAAKFEVDLPFLLQQAAWLYGRHFEGMKKQMQKLGVSATSSAAPSPIPPALESASGSASASGTVAGGGAGVSMLRTGSKGAQSIMAPCYESFPLTRDLDARTPSTLTTKKDLPSAAGDSSSTPGTPRSLQAPISRTPSTTTVTQSRMLASGKQPGTQRGFRTSSGSQRRPPPPQRPAESFTQGDDESALGHDDGGAASETDSEEEPSAMARSQAFRRAPLGAKKPPMRTLSSDGDAEDDDEDDDSGGYLPFATSAAAKPAKDDPTVMLRETAKRQANPTQPPPQPPAAGSSKSKTKVDEPPPSSSASSASSAQQQAPATASSESNTSTSQQQQQQAQRPGPISPRHRAQLTSLSPRYSRREGSEGSPSMGSSFSDLDDASVTQSALEDALLSMQHGGGSGSAAGSMASRMSSLRDALGRRQ